MVWPTKFGGNPFPSLGEKRGQTNKLFPNFSMMMIIVVVSKKPTTFGSILSSEKDVMNKNVKIY